MGFIYFIRYASCKSSRDHHDAPSQSLSLTRTSPNSSLFKHGPSIIVISALPPDNPRSDWSHSSSATAADLLPHARASSFLLSLTATGATVTRTPHGYTLCPSQPAVVLSYSTQTCEEFYRHRSGSWPQDCAAKQPLLSSVVTGTRSRAPRLHALTFGVQECRWMLHPQTRRARTAGARCDAKATTATVKKAGFIDGGGASAADSGWGRSFRLVVRGTGDIIR